MKISERRHKQLLIREAKRVMEICLECYVSTHSLDEMKSYLSACQYYAELKAGV